MTKGVLRAPSVGLVIMSDLAGLLQWRGRIGGHAHSHGGVINLATLDSCSPSDSASRIEYLQIPKRMPHLFECSDGVSLDCLRDLEPCAIFDPTGHTGECGTLCPAALFLIAMMNDGSAAIILRESLAEYALCTGLTQPVASLLAELEALVLHPNPLQSLVACHQVSGITEALRHLMADAILRTADEVALCDETFVSKEHALRLVTPGTLVPVAVIARFIQALGLRAAVFCKTGDIVHRRDIGAVDAPFLGGLLVRDSHMCAVVCDGHAPPLALSTAPSSIRISLGEGSKSLTDSNLGPQGCLPSLPPSIPPSGSCFDACCLCTCHCARSCGEAPPVWRVDLCMAAP